MPCSRRGALRLGHAGHRVVVGERQQLDARGGRVRDDVGGRERPVGRRRMRLQIEGGGVRRH